MNSVTRNRYFEMLDGAVKRSALRKAISEGRVVEYEKEKIDLDNPINVTYLNKHGKGVIVEGTPQIDPVLAEEKRLKIENMRNTARLAEIKIQKLNGELIPTDMVKQIFAIHFQSITKEFNQALTQAVSDLRRKWNGSEDDMAEVKRDLSALINHSIEKAHKISAGEIENLVKEYSQTRERGERAA